MLNGNGSVEHREYKKELGEGGEGLHRNIEMERGNELSKYACYAVTKQSKWFDVLRHMNYVDENSDGNSNINYGNSGDGGYR